MILIIHDDRGTSIYVRPVQPLAPPPRRVLRLTAWLAERCRVCGEWPIRGECACTEEAL